MSDDKSPQEIIDDCNALARLFYKAHGYQVDEGYRFDTATHPQEQGMWNLAVIAYDFIQGMEIDQVLMELEE